MKAERRGGERICIREMRFKKGLDKENKQENKEKGKGVGRIEKYGEEAYEKDRE